MKISELRGKGSPVSIFHPTKKEKVHLQHFVIIFLLNSAHSEGTTTRGETGKGATCFFYSQNQVVKSLNIKHTLPKISNPAYEYQPQQKPVLILLNLKQPSLSVFIYDCTLLDIFGP